MGKYKVCPNCGEHNSPTFMECLKCQTDLMAVKVVDEKTENAQKEEIVEVEMVRVCDCGAENPSGARKCTACGEEISDITPTPKGVCAEKCYKLCSVDGKFCFEVKCEAVIGRENEMQSYLKDKSYVSRSHAKIMLIDGKLYIQNLSNTNFTYVNNEMIPNDEAKALFDGDEIGLGGMVKNGERQALAAYFTVRES